MKSLNRLTVYEINCNNLRFKFRLKQPMIKVLDEEFIDEPESNEVSNRPAEEFGGCQ